jgi:hypothetical protein
LESGSPSNVRRRRRQEFDPDRIGRSRLESIGFVWDANDHQWEDMFAKLEEYHQKHADCQVLQCTLQAVSLTWKRGQHGAQRYQRDKLGSERISTRLESIGFVWWVWDRHALSWYWLSDTFATAAHNNRRFWALNESLSACSYERRSVIALFLANHTPKVSYSFDLKNTGFQRQPTYFFRTTHVEE